MTDAARLLLRIYPWIPLGFLAEVAAFHTLFLWSQHARRQRDAARTPAGD